MQAGYPFRLFLFVILCSFILGCSGGNQTAEEVWSKALSYQLDDPVAITRAEILADSGYALLELGRYQEAITLMQESRSSFPASRWGDYNLACAYSRSGDKSAALAELNRAVEAGWSSYGHLQGDPDLAPLRDDPAFTELINRAKRNQHEHLQVLAGGLPEVAFAGTFPSVDSLISYFKTESQPLYQHGRHLFEWQRTLAQVDLAARRNAAVVVPPDTTIDHAIERVRILGRALGIGQPWGAVATGTILEADNYLATNPDSDKRDEASYWAGVAAFCETHPDIADEDWTDAVNAARVWFAQIPPGSGFQGSAAAWNLMFDLRQAGGDKSALQTQLQEFAARYNDDRRAMSIAADFFLDDMILAEWPLPFETTDLDGAKVTLEQYRGKAVLICYWATW